MSDLTQRIAAAIKDAPPCKRHAEGSGERRHGSDWFSRCPACLTLAAEAVNVMLDNSVGNDIRKAMETMRSVDGYSRNAQSALSDILYRFMGRAAGNGGTE